MQIISNLKEIKISGWPRAQFYGAVPSNLHPIGIEGEGAQHLLDAFVSRSCVPLPPARAISTAEPKRPTMCLSAPALEEELYVLLVADPYGGLQRVAVAPWPLRVDVGAPIEEERGRLLEARPVPGGGRQRVPVVEYPPWALYVGAVVQQ